MKKAFAIKLRGLFDPASNKPFKVSRSGIELYLECPRCFFINHRFGSCVERGRRFLGLLFPPGRH